MKMICMETKGIIFLETERVCMTWPCRTKDLSLAGEEKRAQREEGHCLVRDSNRSDEEALRLELLCLPEGGIHVGENLHETECDCKGNSGIWQ